MDRKECIKILRSVQNELKITRNISDININKVLEEISRLDISINKNAGLSRYYLFLIFFNLFFFAYGECTNRNGIANLIFIIPLTFALKYFNSEKNNQKKEKNHFENEISHIDAITYEINGMEYAIEFLNSLTKEEEEKYLQLKM